MEQARKETEQKAQELWDKIENEFKDSEGEIRITNTGRILIKKEFSLN